MGNSNNGVELEIERKYLIKMPDIKLLSNMYVLNCANIIQTYLKSTDSMRRVRKKTIGSKTIYYFTEKRDITNLVRYEDEREISEKEYDDFLLESDQKCNPIVKNRYSFEYKGKIVELDIYPFWKDYAIAEIEMDSELEQVELPNELELVREVTDENAFSNRNLAQNTDII